MNHDREILFGIVAAQLGTISREQLISALNEWMSDRNRPLSEVLKSQGAIDDELRTCLDTIVERRILSEEGSVARSLARLDQARRTLIADSTPLPEPAPALDAAATVATVVADAEAMLRETLIQAAGDYAKGLVERENPDLNPLQAILPPRYKRLRLHARGGLGDVYLAIDGELNREVALKEIQGRHADNARSRSRFLIEAEVTGNLEHPGIVPVYGLGRYPDGRPYYAMRFIKGENLHDAILGHHIRVGRGTSGDSAARSRSFQNLLRRFLDACNAIAYAHSRGVVHRDIKPQNILVGAYGETLVVDWGLAKAVGLSEDESALSGEGPVRPASALGLAETLAGSALGTPGYMSPEQAAGDLDRVGRSSDVYSLGATLYAILTAQAPFVGPDLNVLLERVRQGDFTPPRSVVPGTPAALDAICLKAMAKKPEDRYASALDLAADVEHWIADEPVAAYPEPWQERLARWSRRHKSATRAAAITLAGVTIAAVSAAILIAGAERRTRDALDSRGAALQLERQARAAEGLAKAEALTNFALARKSVDDYLSAVVNDERLKWTPGLQTIRRSLIEKAQNYYETFLAQRTDDPSIERDGADAALRLGMALEEVGKVRESIKPYEQALAAWKRIAERNADDRTVAFELAVAHQLLGNSLVEIGQTTEARGHWEASRDIRQKLLASTPTSIEYREGLAKSLLRLGNLDSTHGRPETAEGYFRRALELREGLWKEHPTTEQAIRLGNSLITVGNVERRRGRHDESIKLYERGIRFYRSGLDLYPDATELLQYLATACSNLGNAENSLGKTNAALRSYEESCKSIERLIVQNPDVPKYRSLLGRSLCNLGIHLTENDHQEDGIKKYVQARDIQRELVKTSPDVSVYRDELARTLGYLGNAFSSLKRFNDAILSQRECRDAFEKIHAASPESFESHIDLFIALGNLGFTEEKLNLLDASEASYKRSIALAVELAAKRPDDVEVRRDMIRTISDYSGLLARRGKHDQSEQFDKLGDEHARDLVVRTKSDPESLDLRGEMLGDHGARLLTRNRKDEAVVILNESSELLRRALPNVGDKKQTRKLLSLTLRNLGIAYRQLQKPDLAAQSTRACLQLWDDAPKASDLYDAACGFALCLPLIAAETPVKAVIRKEAIATLARAQAAGFNDFGHVMADDDLTAIRETREYQLILLKMMDLAFPVDPFRRKVQVSKP